MNTGTLRKILLFAFFSVLCLLILVPFYAVTIASFKPGEDLIRYGLNLRFDLSAMSLDNFVFLFTGEHAYFTWFFNSLLLTVVQVVLTLLVSATVAYGFSAYEFRGKNQGDDSGRTCGRGERVCDLCAPDSADIGAVSRV
ncbi:ABC-type glycerol-3-phosphate transport system permease component [Paenibacillus sp. PastF-1]|nr:ABC-type glycerol-3-phosphate transport system permease component [Paenibacillus sp. PastF-2]MDF9848302.1 ABC-type glycerol-3-phosphate transport system permease component [Paenibacillus sp. PastM-2]MDF9854745.1 ABC-type glycerol-3-phosphate transport system permease component [Paenibacillus sp. PastF-1]MDH6480015.1 ABC-type glycerol-3-phosphate transport system permease component [Paenibacillus sp. PastH-2]MDH6507448.1 ABC-type glycerol-3-phosphate transport system permease component [Paeni